MINHSSYRIVPIWTNSYNWVVPMYYCKLIPYIALPLHVGFITLGYKIYLDMPRRVNWVFNNKNQFIAFSLSHPDPENQAKEDKSINSLSCMRSCHVNDKVVVDLMASEHTIQELLDRITPTEVIGQSLRRSNAESYVVEFQLLHHQCEARKNLQQHTTHCHRQLSEIVSRIGFKIKWFVRRSLSMVS